MDELTAYFVTTDRRHAAESLTSLQAQGLTQPIVVVRNLRPLVMAYRRTLDCPTAYLLLLDDDLLLAPGVVPTLLDEFREHRRHTPQTYRLAAPTWCEALQRSGTGGLKLFHADSLRDIGWPDAPHLATAQRRRARQLGYQVVQSARHGGVEKAGSDTDVYKKYLWVALRVAASQGPRSEPWPGRPAGRREALVDVHALLARARETNQRLWWLAALGALDARALGPVVSSKDEDLVGPLGAAHDLEALSTPELAALAHAHSAQA